MIRLTQILLLSAFIGPAVSYSNIYLFHILALISGILVITNFSFLKLLITSNLKINLPWIFILVYALLSLIWAPDLKDGLKYLGYMICGTFIVFFATTFINEKSKLKTLHQWLLIAYCIHLGIGFLEIFTDFRWPISEYSRLAPLFGKFSWDFPSFFDTYPTSFFWHQNNFALASFMSLPFLASLEKRRWSLLLTLLTFTTILYSGSKSIIALSILYLSFKSILFLLTKKKISAIIITIILFIGSTLFVFLTSSKDQKHELSEVVETVIGYAGQIPNFLESKIKGETFNFELLNGNIQERFEFMDGAIEYWKTSPILGVGSGGHLKEEYKGKRLAAIHNYWLEILVVLGPIVLVIYLYWLIKMMKIGGPYREALILFMIGAPVLSSAVYFLPKWLLYALCASKYSITHRTEEKSNN